MAKHPAHQSWKVLPHGPLEKLEHDLWRVEGSVPGIPLKRVMTIARLESGELALLNVIALDDDAMRELEAFGRPAFILVPNGWHRLDAKVFADRYPEARVLAPSGGLSKVGEVVRTSGTFADFPADPSVSVFELDGLGGREGAMQVRSNGKTTLVLTDALFNTPHLPGIQGFLFRYVTRSTGGPRVSRLFKLAALKDKKAFRAHLERLATPDLTRIIVAHHETIDENAAEVLLRVAREL